MELTIRTDEMRDLDAEFPGASFVHEETGTTTITLDPSTTAGR